MKAMKQKKRLAKRDDVASRHITPADGNVFEDLGFEPDVAKGLLREADERIAKARKLKEKTANSITQWIRHRHLTQVAASNVLEISRPRVSDLVNCKLELFSLDSLVAMVLRTGREIDLVVHSARTRQGSKTRKPGAAKRKQSSAVPEHEHA